MFLFALATALAAQVAPGPLESFGDWAVACDNVRRCEMTSLLPSDGETEPNGAELSLVREPGAAGAVSITVWPPDGAKGAPSLTIDGARVEGGSFRQGALEFSGVAAQRLATALVNGHAAQIVAGAGEKTGDISLVGASAALRFIDAQQGRAGGVTALVARGPKSANMVPAAAPLPVVPAIAPTGQAAAISPALIARLNKESGCGENYAEAFPQPEPEIDVLGGGATLVLLACGSGAYNLTSAAYVVRDGKATEARFDYNTDLINADWDPSSGTLSTHGKGRGIGDCGEGASYVWDGSSFRLTEATRMDECRGSANWLTVWRAEVRRR
ncbi:DUF1176 domain-containing protein [uncultured Sphingomonas sp.]|uniref:DUF1176 domain-containing protein n=1 Tax=uncultured Sphingomonas sp. TaxID=158754 RepID=UPI0025E839E1|nr:DUF1176 domain-containing protein [uncultured Sphingomonas sp.]